MDSVKFAELDAMIKCGKLDCLKGCCDNLQLLQAIFKDMTSRDLALFRNMLCGCEVKASTPVNPSGPQNTCFAQIVNWVKANKASFNALQILIEIAEGEASGKAQLAIAAVNTALELLEDAVDNSINAPDDPAFASMVMNGYCSLVGKEEDALKWLKSLTDADWIHNLIDAFDAVSPSHWISQSCCSNATPLGGGAPDVPTTWEEPPPPTVVASYPTPYYYYCGADATTPIQDIGPVT